MVPTLSTTVDPLIETAVGLNVMPFKVIAKLAGSAVFELIVSL